MQDSGARSLQARILGFARRPRVSLYLLAAWSLLAAITQLFVNSGVFLDIHDRELDGALGGFALSFNAVPLALLYLFCSRDPERYYQVFWLALAHQVAIVAGNLYHWGLGTFSGESIIVPVVGGVALAALSFAQVFEPRPHAGRAPAGGERAQPPEEAPHSEHPPSDQPPQSDSTSH